MPNKQGLAQPDGEMSAGVPRMSILSRVVLAIGCLWLVFYVVMGIIFLTGNLDEYPDQWEGFYGVLGVSNVGSGLLLLVLVVIALFGGRSKALWVGMHLGLVGTFVLPLLLSCDYLSQVGRNDQLNMVVVDATVVSALFRLLVAAVLMGLLHWGPVKRLFVATGD